MGGTPGVAQGLESGRIEVGVLGDTKKISVKPVSGQFQTSDELRPPQIQTYDMQGNPVRLNEDELHAILQAAS